MTTLTTKYERFPFAFRLNPHGQHEGVDPRTLTAEQINAIAGDSNPSALAAIRRHCLGCVHTSPEVTRCVCISCPLWLYRMGTNTRSKRFQDAQNWNAPHGDTPTEKDEG